MSLRYKVVEIANVTDDEIERVMNDGSTDGWQFESMHFAMRESSKRPSMAFISFTREEED